MIEKALNYLSRILKTDVNYLARGGFFLALIQISGALLGTILTILFANLLPIETFGFYKYVLSLYSLATILSLPGMDTALTQSISNGYDGSFMQALKLKFKWGFLGTIALFVFGLWKYTHGDHTMAYVAVLMGAVLPITEALILNTAFLNGKKLFKVWSYTEIATQFFSIAVLALTIIFTKNIFLLMCAFFIPYIIVRIISLFLILKKYIANANTDPGLYAYGKSLSLFQIIARIIGAVDQIALYHFMGPAQVAIFSLATAIPTRVQSLFRISGALTLPRFIGTNFSDISRRLIKKLVFFGVGIFICCLVYVVLAPYIFTYVFPKYLASLPYSQIAVFYTLSAINYPFASLLFAHKKMRENYILAFANLIGKIVILLIFVPRYGIWGAIMSVLFAAAINIVISLYFLIKASQSTDLVEQ